MAKFEAGNPGKPKGAKNKATRDIRDLIQSSVDFAVLTQKLNEKALNGEKWAFEMLYQYGFGKPVEIQIAPMTFKSEEGKPVEHRHTHQLDAGSTDALIALAKRFTKH